jgi:dTDP-4-dehydrorhamnose 3,5-epimerase-like enzyme
MPDVYPIHDLFIQSIPAEQDGNLTRWLAIRDRDHLLRRFGMAEVVRVEPNTRSTLRIRSVADEVWILIEGKVNFFWLDQREGSPTLNHQHHLIPDQPTLVLVPFGVAFGYSTMDAPALLLRIATHADGEHEGDYEIAWESKI